MTLLLRTLLLVAVSVAAAVTTAVPAETVPGSGGNATTSIPDPPLCVFDTHIGRSPVNSQVGPAHQYTWWCQLRDNVNMPVVNFPADDVDLIIYSPCQNPVVLNPDAPSNAQGEMFWGPATMEQGGGSCEGPMIVEVDIFGATFYTLDAVSSPDQDGDGLVALADLATWQQAFVTQAPLYQGDLDLDDVIALSDLALWQQHFTAL